MKIITTSLIILFFVLTKFSFSQSLKYSTFFGGSNEDRCKEAYIDSLGNIYFAGYTSSSNFPVSENVYDNTFNGGNSTDGYDDIFLTKLSGKTNIEFSTYVGGAKSSDIIDALFVNKNGTVFFGGSTGSSDYPVSNDAYDNTHSGISFRHGDGLYSILDKNAANLLYSTFNIIPGAIAGDNSGNIILLCETRDNFPVTDNAYDKTYNGGSDLGIIVFDNTGHNIVYATYIGGTGDEKYGWGNNLYVDDNSNIYFCGSTTSNDFPITDNAYDKTYNGKNNWRGDAFVVKFNYESKAIQYSTYLGGNYDESASSVIINKENNIVISGTTESRNFPTNNALYPTFTGGSAAYFFTEISSQTGAIITSTYLGSTSNETYDADLETDKNGNIIFASYTNSNNYPTTPNCYDNTLNGKEDIVLTIFNSTLDSILLSTFVGGSQNDELLQIELNSDGNIVLFGSTKSSDFPTTPDAYDQTINGNWDVFITEFELETNISSSPSIEWKNLQNIPMGNFSGASCICDGDVYLIGGRKNVGDRGKYTFQYNIETNQWQQKPDMPTGRWNLAVSAIDSIIYAIGGDSFLDKNEAYNIHTQTWKTLAPMPTPRQHINSAVVDGKIYVIGGLISGWNLSNKNEAFDPFTNTWSTKTPIPTPRQNMGVVAIDSLIYTIGGAGDASSVWTCRSTVEIYNTKTNTWSSASNIPYPVHAPQIAAVGKYILLVGGDIDDDVETNKIAIYDTENDEWKELGSFENKVVFGSMLSYANKLLFVGGCNRKNGKISEGEIFNTLFEGTLNGIENIKPARFKSIPDTTCLINQAFQYKLNNLSFIDDNTLTYSAMLGTDEDLPSWLSFDAPQLTFSGTPISTDTLEIKLIAEDEFGESISGSFFIFIKESINTGLTQIDSNIKIYPNPVDKLLQIHHPDLHQKNVDYSISDLNGRNLQSGKLACNSIDVSPLNAGIYLIKLHSKNETISKKIVIQ